MEMLKVDPKLFITCRLCLKDTGMYQINPDVQLQIKYCFDIVVDPYDTLPQLICGKCETILSEYYATKKTFVEKQQALRARLEVKTARDDQSTQQGVVSSSQENYQEVQKPRHKLKIDDSDHHPPSEPENGSSRSVSPAPLRKKSTRSPKKEPWEADYHKTFICRLCNKICKNRGALSLHLQIHKKDMQKHSHIKGMFTKFCTVSITKVDGKPNIVDSKNVVVLERDKLIGAKGSTTYHVVYTPKENCGKDDDSATENIKEAKRVVCESSDDDSPMKPPTKSRRLRLSSLSSNETVRLNDKSPASLDNEKDVKIKNDREFIEIDDSSDSDIAANEGVQINNTSDPKPSSVSVGDYRTIQSIVTSCQNKYLKRATSEMDQNMATNTEFNINNKILNIGRKLVNKPGLTCKALLRYIEHKNLELEWRPINEEALERKDNFVRIMPKIRTKQVTKEKLGWKNAAEVEVCEIDPLELQDEPVPVTSKGPVFCVDDLLQRQQDKPTEITIVEIPLDSNRAVLYPRTNSEPDHMKLLNANPVANPKKLSRKGGPKRSKPVMYGDSFSLIANEEANLHMPIITSTTSLAEQPINIDVISSVDNSANNAPITSSETNEGIIEQIKTDVSVPEVHSGQDSITETASSSEMPNQEHTTAEVSHSEVQGNTNETTANLEVHEEHVSTASASNSEVHIADQSVPNLPSTIGLPPRIKVKPVSELMPRNATNSLGLTLPVSVSNEWNVGPSMVPTLAQGGQENCVSAFSSLLNFHRPSILQSAATPSSSADSTNFGKPDYVTLHTVQFPNTKTYSPIKYVQDLLQIHNIILMDSVGNVTPDSNSLVKFKVQFSQDVANHVPVILYLSLHISKNVFYLGVRDASGVGFIKVSSLSAGWQWEVLKMYITREDVVRKLIENSRNISETVFHYTNTFLCLLKSIRMINTCG